MSRKLITRFCEICVAIQKIEDYSKDINRTNIFKDEGYKAYDAILMRLITLGEAANEIRNSYKDFAQKTSIDWDGWASVRNIIAHNYSGVDIEIFFQILEDDIPKLHIELVLILENDKEFLKNLINLYENKKEESSFINSEIINKFLTKCIS